MMLAIKCQTRKILNIHLWSYAGFCKVIVSCIQRQQSENLNLTKLDFCSILSKVVYLFFFN